MTELKIDDKSPPVLSTHINWTVTEGHPPTPPFGSSSESGGASRRCGNCSVSICCTKCSVPEAFLHMQRSFLEEKVFFFISILEAGLSSNSSSVRLPFSSTVEVD